MRLIITLIVSIVSMTQLSAQSTDFNNLWQQVETLEVAGSPKTALQLVSEIEAKAKTEKNELQLIKTLLFKSKFSHILEEDAQLAIVINFKEAIANSTAPTKNVLQNMLAKLYWDYFQSNRYKFYDRTATQSKVDETDFRTWDLETLFKEITQYFEASLENGLVLQMTPLAQFDLLISSAEGSRSFRPTLYDVLSQNALQFYKTPENSIHQPSFKFELTDPTLLGNSDQFSSLQIQSKDRTSLQLKALLTYQKLIKFHSSKNNELAIVDADIHRLNFVREYGRFSEKNELYTTALQNGISSTKDPYAKALYEFELANHLTSQGGKYVATQPETNSFKWLKKEALDISETLIKKFPNTVVGTNAKALKSRILQPHLNLTLESFIPITTKSRVLVNYKNHDQIALSAFSIPANKLEKLKKLYDKEARLSFIEKLPLATTWSRSLKNESDYQNHSIEIDFPALENGHYVILARSKNDERKEYAHNIVQITNFAMVEIEDVTYNLFQIVDRRDGKPIKDANCTLTYQKNNRNRTSTSKKLVTNANGVIQLEKKADGYRNFSLEVNTANETAHFTSHSYNYRDRNGPSKVQQHGFLFTDRSIYRPGQTVFFKGIAVETADKSSKVLPKTTVKVTMYDFNGEDVGAVSLTTNEFGSVTGEFVIPIGGVTGQYYVQMSSGGDRLDLSGSSYFRVEEYKRPKFEATFKPITKTYQVNDSVEVQGQALAFAGSTISDAKVSYRVKRQVRYPRWYFYYRSFNAASEAQEIAFGETETDQNGAFKINFKAQPDLKVDTSILPVFNYEITADVTDINGETQSTTTIVNVGYHALLLDMEVADRLDKDDKKQLIKISSENLNNEFVASKGTVQVFKLKAPDNFLRPRPWPAPDYQNFSKAEFKEKYPHDAYTNEDDVSKWERGDMVFSKEFDTNSSKEIKLGSIKKWISGNYVIVASSEDKFGQSVEALAYTQLFSEKETVPADHEVFVWSTNKKFYEPGDIAELSFGSAAAIFVTLHIEKDHKIVETQVLEINNSTEVVKIPVLASDVGGFAIHFHYTAFNSFSGDSGKITVPVPNYQLQVETKTFRDKLQPGTPETWSFKMKGPDGEKVAAEMLASMYDASLDQFTPHNWSFNPQPDLTYYSSRRSNATMSFGTQQMQLRNFHFNAHGTMTKQHYDEFNWFGFAIVHHTWQYQNYLNGLQYRIRSTYSGEVNEGMIEGTVRDKSGTPIVGANITVHGSERGTQTTLDGTFSLKVQKGETVYISYIGYRTESIKIGDKNTFTIQLRPEGEGLDEVVIRGVGSKRSKKALSYSVSSVQSAPEMEADTGIEQFNTEEGIAFLPGADSDQDSINTKKPNFDKVSIRKNLQETAFFFPQLQTDDSGNISFNFTTPEALTRWKVQLLSHTKDLESAVTTLQTITQKELMVVPNAPRFLREGDQITISSKISNLTKKALTGNAILKLTDATTGIPIDAILGNTDAVLDFTISEEGNTQVSWNLNIPSTVQAVQYQIIAKAGDFSDGEQNALPVLSNRMLVTETLPMWVRSNQTKTFKLDKLANNTSTTLKNHKLTLEVTSNPAWYAVQSLPYLMEYPYECNEQTFARYYANSLASHIANENPRIKAVFDQWKSSDALLSNLEKNQELKSLLIQETPWLRDAKSEAEQKKRIALLFDLNKMDQELLTAVNKLQNGQMSSGAWAWFNGGRESRYITQHIITGFGHLRQLGVTTTHNKTDRMITKAIDFLDREFINEYDRLSRYNKDVDYSKDHLSRTQLHYLYMRSFFPSHKRSKKVEEVTNYYLSQIETYWLKNTLYAKGMMALIAHRNDKEATANKILASLKEYSITSEELGMYWKENTASWYWYQAPIETQALMIEAFAEIENDTETVDNLKIWLLKNKQTNRWSTTKATTEAVYALLLQGNDWLSVSDQLEVSVGTAKVDPSVLDAVKVEAGTGYYKTSWNASEISEDQATVTLKKNGDGIAWAGLYWQYFEDLDKITSAETPLQLNKKLFIKKNTAYGEEISEIEKNSILKVGDLVRVRIELKVDREMDYVHMKDMRAAGLEPINVLSSFKYQDGLGYYEATKDASTNFFFERLPKGVFVFEYDLRVNNAGNFSNGITTIQCMYAPEFTSHSEGVRINVSNQ